MNGPHPNVNLSAILKLESKAACKMESLGVKHKLKNNKIKTPLFDLVNLELGTIWPQQ